MGGLLLAILIGPGAIAVLLGLELLENRLLGSVTAGAPDRAGSAAEAAVARLPDDAVVIASSPVARAL